MNFIFLLVAVLVLAIHLITVFSSERRPVRLLITSVLLIAFAVLLAGIPGQVAGSNQRSHLTVIARSSENLCAAGQPEVVCSHLSEMGAELASGTDNFNATLNLATRLNKDARAIK